MFRVCLEYVYSTFTLHLERVYSTFRAHFECNSSHKFAPASFAPTHLSGWPLDGVSLRTPVTAPWTDAVFFSFLPIADALPLKLARFFGHICCPLAALFHLYSYMSAKIDENPWTRKGKVWEWLVNDTDGRAHEACLCTCMPASFLS